MMGSPPHAHLKQQQPNVIQSEKEKETERKKSKKKRRERGKGEFCNF